MYVMSSSKRMEDVEWMKNLCGKLTICFVKDNLSLVLKRVPTFPKPAEKWEL